MAFRSPTLAVVQCSHNSKPVARSADPEIPARSALRQQAFGHPHHATFGGDKALAVGAGRTGL